jgi:glutaredoxin-like protein NrdH
MTKIPVTVYTKSNCVQCEQTKKRFTHHGIEFTEVNLEENPDKLEEFKEMGLLAAPIIETDVKRWSGFRLDKIDSLAQYIRSMDRD